MALKLSNILYLITNYIWLLVKRLFANAAYFKKSYKIKNKILKWIYLLSAYYKRYHKPTKKQISIKKKNKHPNIAHTRAGSYPASARRPRVNGAPAWRSAGAVKSYKSGRARTRRMALADPWPEAAPRVGTRKSPLGSDVWPGVVNRRCLSFAAMYHCWGARTALVLFTSAV